MKLPADPREAFLVGVVIGIGIGIGITLLIVVLTGARW